MRSSKKLQMYSILQNELWFYLNVNILLDAEDMRRFHFNIISENRLIVQEALLDIESHPIGKTNDHS